MGKLGRKPGSLFLTIFAIVSYVTLLGCNGMQFVHGDSPAGGSPGSSSSSSPAASSHTVQLRWAAHRAVDVLGYNVYRAVRSGGPYTRMNPALLPNPDYLDTTVAGGSTYYYVVTAVNVMAESSASSEAMAAIPYP